MGLGYCEHEDKAMAVGSMWMPVNFHCGDQEDSYCLVDYRVVIVIQVLQGWWGDGAGPSCGGPCPAET